MAVDTLYHAVLAIVVLFPVLATICVGFRLWCRKTSSYIGWDDWAIVLALCVAIVDAGFVYKFVQLQRIGLPELPNTPSGPPTITFWKVLYFYELFYAPILGIVKSSVLLFLHRIGGLLSQFKYTIWALFTVNLILTVIQTGITLFQCSPVAFVWNKSIPGGHCLTIKTWFFTSPVLTILTDLGVTAIPIWMFSKMNMDRRIRVYIISVFSLGLIVTAISAWRMQTVYYIQFNVHFDTKTNIISTLTTCSEGNIAIIAACFPTFKPLMKLLTPKPRRPRDFNSDIEIAGQAGCNDGDEINRQGDRWDAIRNPAAAVRDTDPRRNRFRDVLMSSIGLTTHASQEMRSTDLREVETVNIVAADLHDLPTDGVEKVPQVSGHSEGSGSDSAKNHSPVHLNEKST